VWGGHFASRGLGAMGGRLPRPAAPGHATPPVLEETELSKPSIHLNREAIDIESFVVECMLELHWLRPESEPEPDLPLPLAAPALSRKMTTPPTLLR